MTADAVSCDPDHENQRVYYVITIKAVLGRALIEGASNVTKIRTLITKELKSKHSS